MCCVIAASFAVAHKPGVVGLCPPPLDTLSAATRDDRLLIPSIDHVGYI